jgi:hypothetical protein
MIAARGGRERPRRRAFLFSNPPGYQLIRKPPLMLWVL